MTGAAADTNYQALRFPRVRHADESASTPARHPVVIIGAGPVGLSLAIDLAQRDVPVVLLDNDNSLSTGSRAICFAKRTLEIFDRLGCGERMVNKGVSWHVGRVFLRSEPLYSFDLLPEGGHQRNAFINLQQYYVEGYLAERASALPSIDLRWRNELVGVTQQGDHVSLSVQTPDGTYTLLADHLVACDGSRSATRRLIGEESQGRVFRDRFLIADVKMTIDHPAERWFWFDPPFHPGQSVLLHRQPDNVWRIDFQLGWDADPDEEKKPENIIPRVKALLAHSAMKEVPFELEWASVYTFACQRMARFRHGRVLFAGDSAHGVSPFGARGANSGVQDADNLGWKLAAVLQGQAGDALLDSYAAEREAAADENILNSTRATDFITPKSEISRTFRDAVLALSRTHAFARTLVNSGRLSTPAALDDSPLNTADVDRWEGAMTPGAAATDAPLRRRDGADAWWLREMSHGFTLMLFGAGPGDDTADTWLAAARAIAPMELVRVLPADSPQPGPGVRMLQDAQGLLSQRYDVHAGNAYLFRPDQHVCARWRNPDAGRIVAAMRRALTPAA